MRAAGGSPQCVSRLRRILTPVGTGVLVGDISRRVLEAVDFHIRLNGERATIVAHSKTPQGFDVRTFGHEPVVELDGIQLARIRYEVK
ncbi:type I-E CRISPR-associated endoribonuclease Cas2 [Mycolicibacterium conceptionense]|uniref:type I-E CRISPR-associated endoribonuclease Cas2 n=1 Tax=Mycolicibacterium conceptionense TaxID=451644 RepID=UPI000D6F5221